MQQIRTLCLVKTGMFDHIIHKYSKFMHSRVCSRTAGSAPDAPCPWILQALFSGIPLSGKQTGRDCSLPLVEWKRHKKAGRRKFR